jgi:hypothetical protein
MRTGDRSVTGDTMMPVHMSGLTAFAATSLFSIAEGAQSLDGAYRGGAARSIAAMMRKSRLVTI